MSDINNNGVATQRTGDTAPPSGSEAQGGTITSIDKGSSLPSALQSGEQSNESKDQGSTLPSADSLKEVETTKEPDADKGEEGEESKEDEEKGEEQKGAPEEYAEFDISAGKEIGYQMSDEQRNEFVAFGKENDLTDKQMQNILNLHMKREKEVATQRDATNNKLIEDYKKDGLRKSLEIYGDKYATMEKKNKITFEKFFSVPLLNPKKEGETLIDALNDIGISYQSEFFEVLNRITALISEDSVIPGSNAGQDPTKRTLEDAFK